MTSYLYELPTTGAISFLDLCIDQTASYTTDISDATQARANLRAALKESKHSDGEKDYLRLVKVVDDYLPHLYGIKASVDAGEIVLSSEPVFSWRTTLSSNLFNTSPRQSIPCVPADLAFTLLTYAFTLSNLARTNVESLGDYEHARATTEAERKLKDEKIQSAVMLLRKASGVFKHLGEVVIPEWERVAGAGTANRPPEMTQEVTTALSNMALADAHVLAVRLYLSKATAESAMTPGPPLPKSHPPPALIAKIYLECVSLYSSALALALTPSKIKSPTSSRTAANSPSKSSSSHTLSLGKSSSSSSYEISPDLRSYLSSEIQYTTALAHKWLGVDAGENGKQARAGEAVAFLALAKSELEEAKGGGIKGIGKGISGGGREKERKERVITELESVNVFLKYYKKMNDSLHFQPVPKPAALQASIPAGRSAVDHVPYKPPAPAFGPGSVEHAQRQAELLELEEDAKRGEGPEEDEAKAVSRGPRVKEEDGVGAYAGAGSYF